MAIPEEKDASKIQNESLEPAVPNEKVSRQTPTMADKALENSSGGKSKNGPEKPTKSIAEPKDARLTGAEAKKKAKEEKAARRAVGKQGQQPPNLQGNRENFGKTANGKETGSATQTLKSQHRKTGSTAAAQQKPLALRPAEPVAALPTQDGKKDSKKVALFGHLYGTPRRTTIAGAGKDIHPAVLALGLQMSNYIMCGGNARCVATLLVFKRVCEAYRLYRAIAYVCRLLNHTSHLLKTLSLVISLPICRLRSTI